MERDIEREEEKKVKRAYQIAALETYLVNLAIAKAENDKARLEGNTIKASAGLQAVGSTVRDLSLLSAIVNAIPAFYEGTDNTGKGGNLDSNGGFLAVLHENEMVLNSKQTTKLNGMTRDEVVEYASIGKTMRTNPVVNVDTNSIVEAIKNQPVYLGDDYNAKSDAKPAR